ncbi:MAG: SAM-dependent methyltransferase [Propionivibrio sp.]|nr:SAM-dependent methyltransferase [Propionivibrio sp.]MBL0207655.1 SAM-dependent methyltransferase [Propionivibrio sp.]
MRKGRLFLIPVPLGPVPADIVLPSAVQNRAKSLTHFIAENAKSARAFLKSLPSDTPLQQIEICELNEHTSHTMLPDLLTPLHAGSDVGLISEAGCPAVADPGASLVALAHLSGIPVYPMIGPSSILLALMGSGLSGQNFAFHGYLPKNGEQLQKTILELEQDSRRGKRTQIFIETPYRNRQMLEALIKNCAADTKICVATDLTLHTECITTRTQAEWRKQRIPNLERRPSVFLIQA